MAKTKKVKLPFVVEPRREPIMQRIGSEESGVIAIERRGYLTVAEKTFMQQAMGSDNAAMAVQALAARIAKEKGLQVSEVIDIFIAGDLMNEVFVDHKEELISAMNALNAQDLRRKALAASCLLIYRHDPNWQVEDVFNMHPDLVDGLYLLYNQEDQQSLEGFIDDESIQDKIGEESEGK